MNATIYDKVLYEPFLDRRHNLYTLQGDKVEKIREQAASVACFVSKANLVKDPSTNTYKVAPHVSTHSERIKAVYKCPLGEDEPFAAEISLARATGFLAREDILVTAAHVVCKPGSDTLANKDMYVVFGNFTDHPDHIKTEFGENEVFEYVGVKRHSYSRKYGWSDWAFLKLNKPTGRKPLTFNFSPIESGLETSFYMIGYPSGLPGKLTDGATLMSNSHTSYFELKADACGGNSGSFVCREDTGEVVGILCEGNTDYVIDQNYNGTGLKRCVSNKIKNPAIKAYEKCQRISELKFLKHCIERWSIGFKLHTIPLPTEAGTFGFYILGHCTSGTCSVENRWIACGYGNFRLEEILHRTACTACETGKVEVADIGIYASSYMIEGQLATPKSIRFQEESAVAHSKMKSFQQEKDFSWRYLKIQVTKL